MSNEMLTPEQVIPFLKHDDPIVLDHVIHYFKDTSDFGPLTAEHYWEVIDRLGEVDAALGFAANLGNLPQTDASLDRLIRALASKSDENFEFHYQRAAGDMELAVLVRNRDALLACPQLLPRVRQHLELRLKLLDESPAVAWERLMERGIEIGNAYANGFDPSSSDALIEAAARGGEPIFQQALATMAAVKDWREIFAVRVLGSGRYEPAVDALVEKLNIDADVLREEANRALSRIGSLRVVDRIVEFYPRKPWHVRLYANTSLAHIKRPESVTALLKLLEFESALEADETWKDEGPPLTDNLLYNLAELGSLAGLERSRQFIAANPTDPEATGLCEWVLATAIMHGVQLPEEAEWRKRFANVNDISAIRSSPLFSQLRDAWRERGFSEDPRSEAATAKSWDQHWPASSHSPVEADVLEPIRNTAPKVGRNDPCPCGSGKKFKKCCGNK